MPNPDNPFQCLTPSPENCSVILEANLGLTFEEDPVEYSIDAHTREYLLLKHVPKPWKGNILDARLGVRTIGKIQINTERTGAIAFPELNSYIVFPDIIRGFSRGNVEDFNYLLRLSRAHEGLHLFINQENSAFGQNKKDCANFIDSMGLSDFESNSFFFSEVKRRFAHIFIDEGISYWGSYEAVNQVITDDPEKTLSSAEKEYWQHQINTKIADYHKSVGCMLNFYLGEDERDMISATEGYRNATELWYLKSPFFVDAVMCSLMCRDLTISAALKILINNPPKSIEEVQYPLVFAEAL